MDRTPMDRVPDKPHTVLFWNGRYQTDLLRAFLESPQAQTVRALSIGANSLIDTETEYEELVALLRTARLPALELLGLGEYELFSNESSAYGKIGDLTDVIPRFPTVRSLWLFGNFELTRPIVFPAMEQLRVQLDDPVTAINGGPISNATLANLLCSWMPKVTDIDIDLSCDGEPIQYTFPIPFLDGGGMPELSLLTIKGKFAETSAGDELFNSLLGRRLGGGLRWETDEELHDE